MAKLRVGVIGCSGIGTTHASGLIGLPNVELAAGCDFGAKHPRCFQGKMAGAPGITSPFIQIIRRCLPPRI